MTGCCHAAGEAEAEDDVIEATLEEADKAFDPVGLLEGAGAPNEAAELLFAEAVVEEQLFYFSRSWEPNSESFRFLA